MNLKMCRKIVKTFAVVAVLVSPAAALAAYVASGSFEETVDVDGVAVVHVSNESGAVEIIGGDVDQVTIRATIRIDKKLSNSNPMRAAEIIHRVKRSPPVSIEGGRIEISKIKRRSYRRHASISYEVVVPHDSEVNVHSVSGNVKVSGVTGSVSATSETGKVTFAESSPPKKFELSTPAA
jgi:hypothetical protein